MIYVQCTGVKGAIEIGRCNSWKELSVKLGANHSFSQLKDVADSTECGVEIVVQWPKSRGLCNCIVGY